MTPVATMPCQTDDNQCPRQEMVSLLDIILRNPSDKTVISAVLGRVAKARREDINSPLLSFDTIERLITMVTAASSTYRAEYILEHMKTTLNPDQEKNVYSHELVESKAYSRTLLKRVAKFCFFTWISQTWYSASEKEWGRRNSLLMVYMEFIKEFWPSAFDARHSRHGYEGVCEFAQGIEAMHGCTQDTVQILQKYVSFSLMYKVLSCTRADNHLFLRNLWSNGVLQQVTNEHGIFSTPLELCICNESVSCKRARSFTV